MSAIRRIRWQHRYGGYVLRSVVALAILFFLAQIAYHNFHTFFNEQLQDPATFAAFDGATAIAADRMIQLDPDYRILASSSLVNQALAFIYPSDRATLDPARDLPLGASRPTAIFLDDSKEPYFHWLRALYPNAVVREMTIPDNVQHTVLYEVLLSVEDIDSRRGIEATYRAPGGRGIEVREPDLEIDWTASTPVELPFEASWRGILNIGDYGQRELVLEVPGTARLIVDGQMVAEGERRLAVSTELLRSGQLLEIEADVTERGRVSLKDSGQPIDSSAYFVHDEHARGLMASFYRSVDLSGDPVLMQVDPFVGFRYHAPADLAIARPFSARWTGSLVVAEEGVYTLELVTEQKASMYLDGQRLLSTEFGPFDESMRLSVGPHDLEVILLDPEGTPGIYLYWTPPGGQREVIPTANLQPP